MTRSTNMEHVEVLRAMLDDAAIEPPWKPEEVAAITAAIASLSAGEKAHDGVVCAATLDDAAADDALTLGTARELLRDAAQGLRYYVDREKAEETEQSIKADCYDMIAEAIESAGFRVPSIVDYVTGLIQKAEAGGGEAVDAKAWLAAMAVEAAEIGPDPIGEIKQSLEGRDGWHDLSAKVQRKGDTLLIAGLCVTPPAEAQAQGGGEVVAEVVLHNNLLYGRLSRDLPVGTKLYTAPPSAPVGVEGLIEEWESDLAEDKRDGVAEVAIRVQEIHLDQLRALAQQPAAVDGAVVARFLEAFRNTAGDEAIDADEKVAHRWLTAALAAQPGGSDNDR